MEQEALEQSLTRISEELTRIADRQMQVVSRVDDIQSRIDNIQSSLTASLIRISDLEVNMSKKPSLYEKFIFPALVLSLTMSAGNIALTVAIATALVQHMVK